MKKILSLLVPAFLLCIPESKAQYIVSNGKTDLEISGMLCAYYNYHSLKDGVTDMRKNSFYLRDAQLELSGKSKNYEFNLQVDFADIAYGSSDPENPGLMDANFTYTGLKYIDICLGYGKLPYSRSSQISTAYSPFYRRAEIIRGQNFSQRDVGLTISGKLWKDRIRLYGGIYTGMGELCFSSPNDISGNPEYAARIEFSLPDRLRNREMDPGHEKRPAIMLGLNGRFADKKTYTGGESVIRTIDGQKYTYGIDISGMWNGLYASFELHQLYMTPRTSERLYGLNTDYFRAGGWAATLDYHVKPAKSVLALRYQELNQHDLIIGISKRMDAAYIFMLKEYDSALKINFVYSLDEETLPGMQALKWNWQILAGWQYRFR